MAGDMPTLVGALERTKQIGPPLPSNSAESMNLMVHYYRGELGRMAGWRDRIDQTSNWAITVVAALLSVSLSTPTSHHGVLLFAILLITLLLMIEARRYRFFDVYRARVRQLERHYFAEFMSPHGDIAVDWAAAIAKSLRKPEFLISYRVAACRRLRRNYCWMYLILLLAWSLKISSSTMQVEGAKTDVALSFDTILAHAAFGPINGAFVIGFIAVFYAAVLYGSMRVDMSDTELAHGSVHV